ncbi:erythromycin esterase family protein [Clostridium sp. ATCC 25772]|uniref:erythromycin esterase family protein n=1 Tax=Clostridium sp. ATCC 25772 TaxID=1676991 RepID=UPI0007819FBE|nr:erythromycin esterase family protein [Clostridium sp. ATCC 25772]
MKKKGIIIGIIIIIIAIGVGIIYYMPMNNVDYVKKNSRELNLNDINDNKDLDLILDNIKDKTIVCTNENHGINENADIQYKFANYLMDNWDLKYFLMECGQASGTLLNEYLQTGDEKLLDDIFENGVFGAMSDESSKELAKKLYLKNKDLPEEKKLIIIGLDVRQQGDSITYYFKHIKNKYNNIPKDQLEKINKVLECSEEEMINGERSSTFLKAIEDLEKDIKENEEIYIQSLNKEEVFNFECILNNLKNTSKLLPLIDGGISNNKEFYEARDKMNYENFKKIYDHFGGGKYYLHYGMDHIYQREINNVKFLGANLKEDSNFKDKIYSINTLYKNGEAYNYDDLSPYSFYSITTDLEETLKKAGIENGNRIIVLDNKKSPYKKKIFKECFTFIDVYNDEKLFESNKGVTTDYFQAEIIIENPTPIKWYGEEIIKKLKR